MNFIFEGQPAQALKTLHGQARTCLNDAAKRCIELLRRRLDAAIPLQISKKLEELIPVSDGACEPEQTFRGVGAVL